MRENFLSFKQRIEKGDRFLLIYRSKPLAEIKPVKEAQSKSSGRQVKNNLKKLDGLVGKVSLGINLSPKKLKQLYEKSY